MTMRLHRLHATRQQLCRLAAAPQRLRSATATPAAAAAAAAAAVAPAVVFPHSASIDLAGQQVPAEQVIELLRDSVSPERLEKMQQVVAARSYNVVPVVEGLYDMGNLAAVCRSADAFGFGAVHCIMSAADRYKRSQRTAAGADKWLDTQLWDSTRECLGGLKAAGYQIVVTSLTEQSVAIQDIDWMRPTAFVLGNELRGVSPDALAAADATAVIPMAGFVESFNISVAAALVMYEAAQQRGRKLGGRGGDLSAAQQQQLLASFLLRGVKHGSMVVTELLRRPPPPHQQRHFKEQQQQQQAGQADAGVLPPAAGATLKSPAAAAAADGSSTQHKQQHLGAPKDSAAPAA